jgi:hypothetical protein
MQKKKTANDTGSDGKATYRVSLPGFVSDRDIGFGDFVSRVAASAGIQPCGGCGRRAASLNQWLTISGRHTKGKKP